MRTMKGVGGYERNTSLSSEISATGAGLQLLYYIAAG
jgi:hypothetical protein